MKNASLLLLFLNVLALSQAVHAPTVTFVTAYAAKGQDSSNEDSRDYFEALLSINSNLIVFGDEQAREIVRQKRQGMNTNFILKPSTWLSRQKQMFLLRSQKIEEKSLSSVEDQSGSKLQPTKFRSNSLYKLPMLKQALKYDLFESDYFIWLDADYLKRETITADMLQKANNLFEKIAKYLQRSIFIQTNNNETAPQNYHQESNQFTNNTKPINSFVRAGWLGGRVEAISTAASIFQILSTLIPSNYNWTEEEYLQLMLQRYPYLFNSINNLQLRQFNLFVMNYHNYRPVQQMRHVHAVLAENNSLLYREEQIHPTPVYGTKNMISAESSYELRMHTQKAISFLKHKLKFTGIILLLYVVIKLSYYFQICFIKVKNLLVGLTTSPK